MKDKDGFIIRCKYSEWKVINDQDDKDYVCGRVPFETGHHVCYCDDYCRHYEPIKHDS